MNKIVVAFLFLCLVSGINAQKIYHLRGNASIIQYNKSHPAKNNTLINGKNPRSSTDSLYPALSLPFYDDFSYSGPYPDATKWLNKYVYVNRTKAVNPPTLGVATFDGLNQYGFPYDSTVSSSGGSITPPLPSDTLTSYPIRLDSIPSLQQSISNADSVYLSFYYQSMGFWEEPAASGYEFDLDFYSPQDSAWYQVWSISGYYPQDSLWHLVMLPITDSVYFHKGFQFRFRNLSCGCGDDDHWHIDVVKLDKHRKITDTIFNDVSFVYDLQSPLKNYTQMPYNQFTGLSDMKTHISAFLRNNYYNPPPANKNNPVSIVTHYNIFDVTGSSVLPGSAAHLNGSNNLNSFYNAGYCNNDSLIYPSLWSFSYKIPLTYNDSFAMKFYIDNLSDLDKQNDTITFHQTFSNYFSYDDGSAEGAFGIESINCPGNYQTAASFKLNKPDMLRSIDIFFDPIIDVGLLQSSPFNLMIWSDNAGLPGAVMYKDTAIRYTYFAPNQPVPGVQRVNMFNRYQLTKPIILPANTTFYIGINQINNYPAIPIGYDMNTDYHNNMFFQSYDIHCIPTWYPFPGGAVPAYRGALMMHPVFGDSLLALGIKKYNNGNNNTVSANITVYPNPAADMVYIQSDNTITKVVVMDLLGSIVIQQSDEVVQSINTASLQNGAYLIKAFTNKGLTDTKKLIISR